MSRSLSWRRLSFQAKVLLPVVVIMVLLVITTIFLVNQRITKEFQSEAAQKLTAADAVFKNSQKIRSKNLLRSYRTAANDPRFKAVAQKGDARTLRFMLTELLEELGGEMLFFTSDRGQRVATAVRDPRLNAAEFEASSATSVKQALEGQSNVDTILVGDRLFDVVSIPVSVGDNVVGVIGAVTFGAEIGAPAAEEFKQLTHTEIVFRTIDKVTVSTLMKPHMREELMAALDEPASNRADVAAQNNSTIRELVLDNEHFLALIGQFTSLRQDKRPVYLLLSSYEQPLTVLHATQHMLTLVSTFGILLSIGIVWMFIRKVTQPLRDLRTMAEAVGHGDFSHRVPITSNDECAELGEVFNEMTENLKTSREQLEKTVETLKTTQAQLIQSEKLSAVGEFVAGVAHELNNPLTSVVGFAELMQQSEVTPQHRRFVDLIVNSAQRCHKIVEGLLSFARQHKPERKPVKIRDLLEATIGILQYHLRTSNIEVITKFDPELPKVLADPHQLQQVFLNILNNARQAIETSRTSGVIRITTESDEKGVRIIFRDDGPGISEENLAKIFNPFFTTKDVGKGTGLGLSLSYGIIKEHGGSITAESELGGGATFTIELPLPPAGTSIGTTFIVKETAENFDGDGKRVLVVDDEELILDLIREALKTNGCHLDVVRDGESALRRLREGEYDVTICDWRMPGMNGQQLYEQVLAENSAAASKFVFMTGDVMNDKTQEFLKQTGNLCLAKPFSVDEFRSTIGKFLKAA